MHSYRGILYTVYIIYIIYIISYNKKGGKNAISDYMKRLFSKYKNLGPSHVRGVFS